MKATFRLLALAVLMLVFVSPAFAQKKFDGAKLYNAAYGLILDTAYELHDPAARAKFAQEWEHKYDNDDSLSTEGKAQIAMNAMIQSLHHRFDTGVDKQVAQALNGLLKGETVGIGVQLRAKGLAAELRKLPKDATNEEVEPYNFIRGKRQMEIMDVLPGSPAEEAMLQPGDLILAIDDVPLDGMRFNLAATKLKGEAKSKVTLTIGRPDGEQKVTLARRAVISRVVRYKDLGDGIARISIANFRSQHLPEQMSKAMSEAAGAKALILDLRGNFGGRMDFANDLAARFIPKGDIVTVKLREGDQLVETSFSIDEEHLVRKQTIGKSVQVRKFPRPSLLIPKTTPIVILVDYKTGSASELLAIALQANGRAFVIGTPETLCKGSVQNEFDLPSEYKMVLTVGEFLPAGKVVELVGVKADLVVKQQASDNDDLLDAGRLKALELIGK